MKINFGAVAEDYANFRSGFPESLFARLALMGIGSEGQKIIDVGTGTGSLGRGFALHGAKVIGIDPDERLLEQAKKLDLAAGVAMVYKVGKVEALPLEDNVADVVSAGQCWHWFKGPIASREIARVTKPNGRIVIAHFDWLPVSGNIVEITERLIMKHNPSWHGSGGNGFHPESIPYLRAAGYDGFESFSYDIDVTYKPEAWRGRIRASAGVGASLSRRGIEAFDAELKHVVNEAFPEQSLLIPHRVFAIVAVKEGRKIA